MDGSKVSTTLIIADVELDKPQEFVATKTTVVEGLQVFGSWEKSCDQEIFGFGSVWALP